MKHYKELEKGELNILAPSRCQVEIFGIVKVTQNQRGTIRAYRVNGTSFSIRPGFDLIEKGVDWLYEYENQK